MTAEGTTEVATAELTRAASSTMQVLRAVRAEQLSAPTPCASWDVHALINHFIGSARWWAVLLDGRDEGPAVDYAAGDYLAAYKQSIRIATNCCLTALADHHRRMLPSGLGAAELERLLVRDAVLEATPMRTWYQGRETCVPFLRAHVLGTPGTWRMFPTRANGQAAITGYVRDSTGVHRPYGVTVLTVVDDGISRVTSFGDPDLVAAFGFPALPPGPTR